MCAIPQRTFSLRWNLVKQAWSHHVYPQCHTNTSTVLLQPVQCTVPVFMWIQEDGVHTAFVFTVFSLGRVIPSFKTDLSLQPRLHNRLHYHQQPCTWPCVSGRPSFCLSVCLCTCCFCCDTAVQGACRKTYFTSRVHCRVRGLQKINKWLVFLTFAQWSLPLLHFPLHKSKSRKSKLRLLSSLKPSSCHSFWCCIYYLFQNVPLSRSFVFWSILGLDPPLISWNALN